MSTVNMNACIFVPLIAVFYALPVLAVQLTCRTSKGGPCHQAEAGGALPPILAAQIADGMSAEFCTSVGVSPGAPLSAVRISRQFTDGQTLAHKHAAVPAACSRSLNCEMPTAEDRCGTEFGSKINHDITWLSVISSQSTGAASGVWSSGIPEDSYNPRDTTHRPLKFIFFNESATGEGFTALTEFQGTPLSKPLTASLVFQPSHHGKTSPVAIFLFTQFALTRDDDTEIPLKTMLWQHGSFRNGNCVFDGIKYASIPDQAMRKFFGHEVNSAHERHVLHLPRAYPFVEVKLTVKQDECVRIVTSTGKPCCSVRRGTEILLKQVCDHSDAGRY